jgi:uncharacterized protein YcfJ
MKRLILTILTAGALTSAPAQLFGPDSLNGAFLGTVIGGFAGGNHHYGFSGRGAAIGAGVGLLAGAIVGEARPNDYYASQPCYYATPVYATPGYGYAYAPAYVSAPAYVAAPQRPNYAVGGTLTGALAGGLIGAGFHRGWEGAGIGAASGLVLGSVAEVAAQRHEQRWAAPQVAPMPQVYRPVATPGWGRQIPDAPGVPDAPTF